MGCLLLPRGSNRHRRLDREAALLTREAEADANRWGDTSTLSSSAPRSPSSSSSPDRRRRHGAVTTAASYSNRYEDSSNSGGGGGGGGNAGVRDSSSEQDSTSDLMHAGIAPSFSRSGNVGGPSWRYRIGAGVSGGAAVRGETETSLGVGTGVGLGVGGGGTGMEAATLSWDRELARTMARGGPAAPGWPSRWRPGGAMMPGSRASLGLWERAGGLDGDDEDDEDGDVGGGGDGTGVAGGLRGEISPRGNVDTAQEVS